jgi:purine-binding chemotaxis protein CheW
MAENSLDKRDEEKLDNSNFIENIEEHQYLTFLLCGEVFAIEILNINEIISYQPVATVPHMQEYVKGVMNIRGNVVPVVSLGKRLGLGEQPITKKSATIIIESNKEDEDNMSIGLLVDVVNEVFDILPDKIEQTPNFGTKIRSDFIKKIGKVDGKFISILNLDSILDINDLSMSY